MKNASGDQILNANFYGKFVPNVVYFAEFSEGNKRYSKKIHVKHTVGGERVFVDMEDNFHIPNLACTIQVWQQTTGPSQKPKRSKRKPVKGTRPETLIPMSSDVKLKVGDKVRIEHALTNGSTIGVVTELNSLCVRFKYIADPYRGEVNEIYFNDFKDNLNRGYTITHKIIPWTPPAPAYKPECVAFKSKEGKVFVGDTFIGTFSDFTFNPAEKCAEELAFDKGYWVTHQSTPDSACPLWARSLEVQVFLQDGFITISDLAHHWNWASHADSDNIVAYRKAQQ